VSAAVPYQVAWRWRHDSQDEYPRHDDVEATTAVRAMNKVFKSLAQEYAITRRDVEFLEVYRI
jgi:ribosomal protein L20A (L18A)